MPDELTAVMPGVVTEPSPRFRPSRRAVLDAVVVVVAFVAAGAICGLIWESLWQAPAGVALKHEWFLRRPGEDFSGTGIYVLVALAAGLAVSVVVALTVERDELVTLVAALVGSALAAWVMYAVGHRLGPADPRMLAQTAKNWDPLPADLRVEGGHHAISWLADQSWLPSWLQVRIRIPSAPFLAFPFGTAFGLIGVYFGFSRRGTHASTSTRR
jgi:hypothetical protein